MSSHTYMELPEDYLELYMSYAHSQPKKPEIYAHTLSLLTNGWSPMYLRTHYNRARDIFKGYRGVDISEFELPTTPIPHEDSPHIAKLTSIYTQEGDRKLGGTYYKMPPLMDVTKDQAKELHSLFKEYSSHTLFTPRDHFTQSPKYHALAKLAKKLLFYYTLGVPPTTLARSLTGNPNAQIYVVYKILRMYYQWPTPFLTQHNRNIFSLIYSPLMSLMERDILDLLNPSKENVEQLSQTPHLSLFGKDLTIQKHLFRRTSYRSLFRALPEKATLLPVDREKYSELHDHLDALAVPDFDLSTLTRSSPTTESTH